MSLEVFVRYSTKKVFVKNIYRGFQLFNCDNGYGDDCDDHGDDIVGVHGGERW